MQKKNCHTFNGYPGVLEFVEILDDDAFPVSQVADFAEVGERFLWRAWVPLHTRQHITCNKSTIQWHLNNNLNHIYKDFVNLPQICTLIDISLFTKYIYGSIAENLWVPGAILLTWAAIEARVSKLTCPTLHHCLIILHIINGNARY